MKNSFDIDFETEMSIKNEIKRMLKEQIMHSSSVDSYYLYYNSKEDTFNYSSFIEGYEGPGLAKDEYMLCKTDKFGYDFPYELEEDHCLPYFLIDNYKELFIKSFTEYLEDEDISLDEKDFFNKSGYKQTWEKYINYSNFCHFFYHKGYDKEIDMGMFIETYMEADSIEDYVNQLTEEALKAYESLLTRKVYYVIDNTGVCWNEEPIFDCSEAEELFEIVRDMHLGEAEAEERELELKEFIENKEGEILEEKTIMGAESPISLLEVNIDITTEDKIEKLPLEEKLRFADEELKKDYKEKGKINDKKEKEFQESRKLSLM